MIMAESAYLTRQREQYTMLSKSIEGLKTRAAEANRDLTSEELRSIGNMGEQAAALYAEIESLTDIELRNAGVEAMEAKLRSAIVGSVNPIDGGGTAQTRGSDQSNGGEFRNVGGATTQDRDPGIYTRGAAHSFLGDQYRSVRLNDQQAADRLLRHSNALRDNEHLRDVLGAGATTFGAGLVPPVWLAEQFAPVLHRRLRLASQLRQVPWAGPFAWSIPVAGTQAKTSSVAEGVNTTETDPAYSILTVTPKAIMGYSEVSRQMLEASNPAVDSIIWGDLLGDFYDNCELEVISALNAQAGVNTVTVSAGPVPGVGATTSHLFLQRAGLLDSIAAIGDNNAGDADLFVGRNSRWTTYLKFMDTVGRPIILAQRYNPQNAVGRGDLTQAYANPLQGDLENIGVVTSPTVAASTGFVLNSQEHLFSISPPIQFQFEQPAGPALVRVGIWGYECVTFGRRPKAVTKITYSGS
jgi:HK97 family phage major capsid protein